MLALEPATECYTGEHLPVAIVAWMVLFGFCLGFPIWCGRTLLRSARKGLSDLKQFARYGFLYRGLRDKFYWFRLTQFLANAIIAIELTLLDTVASKMFVAGILFIIFSTLVGMLLPYLQWYNNAAFVGIGKAFFCADLIFFFIVFSILLFGWRHYEAPL